MLCKKHFLRRSSGNLKDSEGLRPTSHPVIIPVSKVLTMLLHNLEELDDDFRRRSDKNLSLSSLFSVVDGVESVGQNGGSSHSLKVSTFQAKTQ
ncbi:hypothetical protein OGATHE_006408 [Ogataea polymorpha]|uniref:Uncharacterized protein n=1 Tax=Ogataea polymorpha TaxID=460523 RepID=A0A9P8SXX5_9ASCO|nr:hypothetical protein OGATHE_006408 [Ogataea polymorpha]